MSHHGLIHQLCYGGLVHACPNVYSETHVPEGLGWPPSSQQSNDPPNVTWYMKHYPVCEYSILNMMGHCDFPDAIQMCVVECVISHPGHQYNMLLFHPYERPFMFKFMLLKVRSIGSVFETV